MRNRCGDKKCQIREGIVFASNNKWYGIRSIDLNGSHDVYEGTETQISEYENYAKEGLRRPKYQRMRISLERLARTLALIESSWQRTNRKLALKELENVLNRQHELEKEAENIEDVFLRGYIYEQLDSLAAARRFLAEEVRWDIESSKEIL